jgi:hypothetical protein
MNAERTKFQLNLSVRSWTMIITEGKSSLMTLQPLCILLHMQKKEKRTFLSLSRQQTNNKHVTRYTWGE